MSPIGLRADPRIPCPNVIGSMLYLEMLLDILQ